MLGPPSLIQRYVVRKRSGRLQTLEAALGLACAYRAYESRTKRLIPGIW